MKRNNPLNIRYNPLNSWHGQSGQSNGFVEFISLFYGQRAALKLLINYYHNGYRSVESIITRFAPPSENPTSEYINFILSKYRSLGFFINENTTIAAPAYDGACILQWSVLLYAMTVFENGSSDISLCDWIAFMNISKIKQLLTAAAYDSKCDL